MSQGACSEAYDEGAFFAETDGPWSQKERERSRPESMAEHCQMAWRFVLREVCPEWATEQHRAAFLLGYEDRATELADAGESGYQALAEAGGVADNYALSHRVQELDELVRQRDAVIADLQQRIADNANVVGIGARSRQR